LGSGAAPEGAGEAQQRNELGQFVKQSDKGPAEPKQPGEPRAATPKAPKLGADAAPPEVIAPASWSPAAKQAFAALPEVIKSEITKREQDWNAGLAQRSSEAERLNRLHQVLGPYAERFRLAGIGEAQAVQQLFAASDYLDRDPVNALLYLARTKGVDPRLLAQVFTGNGQGQPQVSPEYQQLAGQVQALTQTLQQRDYDQVNAQYQHMLGQVETFARDAAHPYFENVRAPMADLIQMGLATSLEEAYQQATWGHPEIRPFLLQQQAAEAAKAAADAARAKAAQARHASGSITGSPSPGATSGSNGSRLSLRDELRQNFAEFST
jgi:hypothetical protein